MAKTLTVEDLTAAIKATEAKLVTKPNNAMLKKKLEKDQAALLKLETDGGNGGSDDGKKGVIDDTKVKKDDKKDDKKSKKISVKNDTEHLFEFDGVLIEPKTTAKLDASDSVNNAIERGYLVKQ